MNPKLKKGLKITGITLASIVGVVVLAAGSLILYLSATEYNPDDKVALDIERINDKQVRLNQEYKLFSWNVGYCALDETADFFMDGGSEVRAHSKSQVEKNLNSIKAVTSFNSPDFVFYQEADEDSARSYYVNEVEGFTEAFSTYSYTFAYNYKCDYVPYPIPPMGKVRSGLLTMSKYQIDDATRIKLPTTFSWPIRVANLKRCLSVNRLPIDGSDKSLVLINLHLEAYDDGEAKIAQTKLLLDVLKEEAEAGNYVIAGGDWNQTFSTVDLNKYPVGEGEWTPGKVDVADFDKIGYQALVDDSTATCRLLNHPLSKSKSQNTYYVIDGMVASSNVKINSFSTLDYAFINTDHNPTFLNFTLE